MNKILFFFLVFTLIAGCEKNNSIEVIPSYDSIYLTKNKVDKPPELIKGDENKLTSEIENSLKNNELVEYKLLLNEKGNVEKIAVVTDPGEKFSNLIAKRVADWLFEPAIKNGKAVKSQFILAVNLPADVGMNDSAFVSKADVMPEILGGIQELQKNIKYPEKAKVNGIEGKVFVKVYIDETGMVNKTDILKSAGTDLDAAAVDAVKKLKFTPGEVGGKPVKVVIVIPIVFKLS